MEHSRIKKRNVALIEKCVMSSIGIESLFRKFAGNPYKLHTYTSQESFQDAMSRDLVCGGHFFFFCHEKCALRGIILPD
ncbi:LuxR family transcriptional regulator [Shigella dysenteriae]|uniref:LuxR family transcriptional regulator n=1 Tax=Shigella dysenteriae TaxID=622 RepID=A0A2X2IH57_SHIDY|nr:LuxR family transcriptional regulator [Shigella dysenteriae]